MKEIQDINFGVKTWYLKPTFLIKIGTALMSLSLVLYILIITNRFADVLWKQVIGRSHIIQCMFMTFTVIGVAVAFLFYFYKIFGENSLLCFFVSISLGVIYVIEFIVFCGMFASHSKWNEYTDQVINHVSNTTDAASTWFLEKYNAKTSDSSALSKIVQDYCYSRTVGVKTALLLMSMIWVILYVLLLFVVLFEAKPNQGKTRDLRPGVEI